MAPITRAVAKPAESGPQYQLDPEQTLRAANALLRKIQSDDVARKSSSTKADLLADEDSSEEPEDEVPVWLVLTTKKHVSDQKRLKPAKIVLPHPYRNASDPNLRICIITADPQRTYKDLVAHPSFPTSLSARISRVIGITKLKAKYKSYESRRQLFGEYDVFLADDRIITYLPQVLGKVFYKGGSKRPVPITLEGKRQNVDETGAKRQKLSEGGKKVTKSAPEPKTIAEDITRAVSAALVHLAPSVTTAVKVGKASMTPADLQENIEAVTKALVDKHVPQQWRNVRAIHVKGPNTVALPIWLADELWETEKDVLEEAPPEKLSKKRKRALENAVIEVPGADGKMRRLEKPSTKRKSLDAVVADKPAKKSKGDVQGDDSAKAAEKAADKAEKALRKEKLTKQKADARAAVEGAKEAKSAPAVAEPVKKVKKARMKASDLI